MNLHMSRFSTGRRPVGICALDLAVLMLYHPMECLDIIKRERARFRPLPALVLLLLAMLFQYAVVFFTHFPLADQKPQDANLLLEAALVAVPLLSWVVASYALSSILSGECKLTEGLTAACYCLVPYVVFTPLIHLLSNLMGGSEAGIFNFFNTAALLWTLALLFVTLKRLNDYSFFKAVLVTVLSLVMMVVIWAVSLLIFSMVIQVVYFLRDLFTEMQLKYFY